MRDHVGDYVLLWLSWLTAMVGGLVPCVGYWGMVWFELEVSRGLVFCLVCVSFPRVGVWFGGRLELGLGGKMCLYSCCGFLCWLVFIVAVLVWLLLGF